jgi:hypothetical protein
MKRTSLKFAVVVVILFVSTVVSSKAQGTFRFDLGQQILNAWLYGGLGSLTVDASTGQFVIDVVDPYSSDSFTPLIITPSGTLSFSLGTGVPVRIPIGQFGEFMNGVQYDGSFSSSPAVYSDLLAGLGEMRFTADSGVVLSGSILNVPEPSALGLFLLGMLPVFWRKLLGRTYRPGWTLNG